MKSCPTCGARYDDDLSFCLQDGSRLTAVPTFDLTSNPTEQLPKTTARQQDVSTLNTIPPTAGQTASPPRRFQLSAVDPSSRMGCVVTVGTLSTLLIVSVLGFIGLYSYNLGSSDLARSEPKTANVSSPPDLNEGPSTYPSTAANNDTSSTGNTANIATPANRNVSNPPASPVPPRKPQPSPSRTADASPKPTPAAAPSPSQTPGDVFVMRPARKQPIAGGVLNGKAISLPKPAYPPAARAVGASGTVVVRVLIDEDGNVIAAEAVSGHPLLRAAAVGAARAARFRPTLVSGQPVKVTGVITYNFVP